MGQLDNYKVDIVFYIGQLFFLEKEVCFLQSIKKTLQRCFENPKKVHGDCD